MEFCSLVLIFTTIATVYGGSIPEQLVSAASARGVPSDELGVYDGEPTTIEAHPYITNLLLFDGILNCTATIVSDQWVVSNGECSGNIPPSKLRIVAGSNDGGTGEKYDIEQVLVHPQSKYYDYDVTLLKIAGKFKWSKKVKPIRLPKDAPKDNATMVVAGYGKTSYLGGESNGNLLQGFMVWLPYKTCEKIYRHYVPKFTDRMNCVYNAHKTTLCKGDWATPIVRRNVFYGMFLAGFTSGFCKSSAPPLLVSNNLPFVKWIKDNTGALYEDEL